MWGSTSLSTVSVSATKLTALVPAAQIASSGTVNVTVALPGGATTTVKTFTVN